MGGRSTWGSWGVAVVLAASTVFALQTRDDAIPTASQSVDAVLRIEPRTAIDGATKLQVIAPGERPAGLVRVSAIPRGYRMSSTPPLNESRQDSWRSARLRIGPFRFVRSSSWRGRLLWVEATTNNTELVLAVNAYGRIEELLLAPMGTRFVDYQLLVTGDIIATVASDVGTAPNNGPAFDPRGVWLLPPNATSKPTRLPGRRFVVSPDASRAVILGQNGPALLFDATTQQMSRLLEVPNRRSVVSPPGVAWVADGQTLLAVREIRERFESALVDPSNDRVVRVWGREGLFVVAAASPDGHYLAIARSEPGEAVWVGPADYPAPVGREMEFFDIETGRSWTFRTEGDDERILNSPVWSSDAAWFITGRPIDRPPEPETPAGLFRLWRVEYDGSRQTFELANRVPGVKRLLGVSPTGRYAAMQTWEGQRSDLILFDRDTDGITRLEARSFLAWLSGGRLLVRRSEYPWLVEVFTLSGLRLGDVGESIVGVSPDGQALAIARLGAPLTYVVVTPNPVR